MSRLTVEQAVQKYLRHLTLEKGASEHTVSNYARDLHRYSAFLTDQGISDPEAVTAATIEAFVLFLSTPDPVSGRAALAASSRARATVAVRSLHKFLLLDGAVETNPAADVRPPATGSRLPKALSIAETAALIDAAGEVDSADPIVVRNRALLEVLYATGARVSELCAMDLDDVDPEDSWIRVTGKGNKQRAVPMGTTAHAALQAYIVRARPVLNKRGTAALFINQRGTRMGRQSVWTVLKDAAERAEINDEVSPHTLRHCFATHLLEGGADVRVVQELLGHASVTTTQIYTKVTASLLREVWQQAHPRAGR